MGAATPSLIPALHLVLTLTLALMLILALILILILTPRPTLKFSLRPSQLSRSARAPQGRLRRRRCAAEVVMLKVYSSMIHVLGLLRTVLTQIERHDRDLGNQLRRAASSVALNTAEGSGSHGGTRLARYRTALGSARETGACLDVAVALGYVERVDGELLVQLDQVRAMLAVLVR